MNITALDKAFSTFIRLRDAKGGIVKCISCGKLVPWKESDAGHYINRKHMATRYDEQNVAGQCRSCNRFSEGNMHGFMLGLIARYGPDVPDKLYIKKFNSCKMSQVEVNILTKYYKDKTKLLCL